MIHVVSGMPSVANTIIPRHFQRLPTSAPACFKTIFQGIATKIPPLLKALKVKSLIHFFGFRYCHDGNNRHLAGNTDAFQSSGALAFPTVAGRVLGFWARCHLHADFPEAVPQESFLWSRICGDLSPCREWGSKVWE